MAVTPTMPTPPTLSGMRKTGSWRPTSVRRILRKKAEKMRLGTSIRPGRNPSRVTPTMARFSSSVIHGVGVKGRRDSPVTSRMVQAKPSLIPRRKCGAFGAREGGRRTVVSTSGQIGAHALHPRKMATRWGGTCHHSSGFKSSPSRRDLDMAIFPTPLTLVASTWGCLMAASASLVLASPTLRFSRRSLPRVARSWDPIGTSEAMLALSKRGNELWGVCWLDQFQPANFGHLFLYFCSLDHALQFVFRSSLSLLAVIFWPVMQQIWPGRIGKGNHDHA